MTEERKGLSLSSQIAIGMGLGIAVGVFLGEYTSVLSHVADGYVKLLQMTVLPYVTVSLISGLGTLDYEQAKLLFVRVGGLILLLWAITLGLVFLMPLSFPAWESASFFSTSLLEPRQEFNFVDLYIPANPFHSLANNVVPAVVLFSVLLGVALMGIENKKPLIDVLQILNRALTGATRFVVRLTPLGVFAIAAHASGTMSVDQFGRLQVYFISYIAMALLVTFWLLPGLVNALTSIPYREILSETKDALMTAFVTANLFIVLPILSDAGKHLLRKHDLVKEDDTTTDIIVPASFNIPHTGKILSLSFILFAGWFADAAVSATEYPTFAATGILSFFGSLNVAVPFMLDLFRVPADMFELFLASGVVNARFGTLVAAMHMVVLAVAGTCAVVGAVSWSPRRLLRYAFITTLLTVATVGGLRFLFVAVFEQEYDRDTIVSEMHLLSPRVEATVHRAPPEEASGREPGRPLLEQVLETRTLRVGYTPDSLPYAYFNRAGDLVGHDVEMAHVLAEELGVNLEFVPLDPGRENEQLVAGYCDVGMTGLAVTTPRAAVLRFSEPYMTETLAFLVNDHARGAFTTRDSIRAQRGLRVIVPDLAYIRELGLSLLPSDAEVILANEMDEFFGENARDVDALLLTAERGSTWTLLYPNYSVVVPQPDIIRIPIAYAVGGDDQGMADFLSHWIALKRADGTLPRLYNYWILGKNASPAAPRWSVIRNVLGWVD